MIRDHEWLIDTMEALDRVFYSDAITESGVTIRWWPRFRQAKTRFTSARYAVAHRLILVNPVLRHDWVPDEYVSLCVWHEMVHARQNPRVQSDWRRYVHDEAFRIEERRHPHFAMANAWEDANFSRLMAASPPKERP